MLPLPFDKDVNGEMRPTVPRIDPEIRINPMQNVNARCMGRFAYGSILRSSDWLSDRLQNEPNTFAAGLGARLRIPSKKLTTSHALRSVADGISLPLPQPVGDLGLLVVGAFGVSSRRPLSVTCFT